MRYWFEVFKDTLCLALIFLVPLFFLIAFS